MDTRQTNTPPFHQEFEDASIRQTSKVVFPVLAPPPLNVEALTPIERQRLDHAVMLLINYLTSASSSP